MIYNTYADQKEKFCGIQLVSCGHIFAKPEREINRPNGRDDWLLFYIVKESETFYLDSTKVGKAGSFIIFAPGQKQHHKYIGDKTAEFYFIHFKCDEFPPDISLDSFKLYDSSPSRHVCDVFEEIIEETQCKNLSYEKSCASKLLYLFTVLERNISCVNYPYKENVERIARAIQHMNKNYNSNLKLEDYAAMCSMSKHHFLRMFKKIVGVTPLEYRNNIRMQYAVDLIAEEKLSVEQISEMTGYSSLSYFSIAFKQKYGLSPKQYQKNIIGSGKV